MAAIISTPENDAKFARMSSSYERKWQQIMDRLEGRLICYANAADKCKGGPKQYTKSQLESAKSKAMQEARLIVWMFKEDDDALASESQRIAAGTADEKPDGQAENANVMAAADNKTPTKETTL